MNRAKFTLACKDAELSKHLFRPRRCTDVVRRGARAQKTKMWRPVVIMHGLNGNAQEFHDIVNTLEDAYPGIYVHVLNILNGNKSLFTNMKTQMQIIRETILSDPKLKDGFNFYGESQGALEARVYVSKFSDLPVYNLIALNGPQAGVGECAKIEKPPFRQICANLATLLQIYDWPFCSFCNYWKDNRDKIKYRKHSKWLAEINNEDGIYGSINQTYVKNMESLNQYVVVRATKDKIVQPSYSAFHQYWEWGDKNRSKIIDLNETEGYKNNWLGLKTLNERGDYIMKEFDGDHVSYSMQWWRANILPFFNNTLKG